MNYKYINMSKTGFEKVVDFNKCFGSLVSLEPNRKIYLEHPNIVNLKYGLVDEEVNELIEAYLENDIVEVVDALCDIKYVLYGMAAAFGINMDDEFKEYISRFKSINTDFSKNMGDFEMVNSHNDYKYSVKNYNENVKNVEFKTNNDNVLTIIKQINNSLKTNTNNSAFDEMTNDLCKLLYFVNKMGCDIGINLDEAFDIVHRSNMSKVCPSEDLAKETVTWYLENDDRYKTPDYRESEYGWVVFNKDTGKILKSIKYTPANFDRLL
jgi:predicted HAD superfamily Cof-like phosphohydrolase